MGGRKRLWESEAGGGRWLLVLLLVLLDAAARCCWRRNGNVRVRVVTGPKAKCSGCARADRQALAGRQRISGPGTCGQPSGVDWSPTVV